MRRSKGGRPRKEGPRHPSGQLVQKVEPNAKVVALRRALLGEAPSALMRGHFTHTTNALLHSAFPELRPAGGGARASLPRLRCARTFQ